MNVQTLNNQLVDYRLISRTTRKRSYKKTIEPQTPDCHL